MTPPVAPQTTAPKPSRFAALATTPWLVGLAIAAAVVGLLCVAFFPPEAVLCPLGVYALAALAIMPLAAHLLGWPAYSWPTAMLSTAALLLICSLLFQTARDTQTMAFAEAVALEAPGQPFALRVRAPESLRQRSGESRVQPLEVVIVTLTPTVAPMVAPATTGTQTSVAVLTPGPQITATASPTPSPSPTVASITYTLRFSHDDSVEFVDPAGTITPPQLTFTWPNDVRHTALLRLSAGADMATSTTTLTAQLAPAAGQNLTLGGLAVVIEPVWRSSLRLFAGRLLGDISLLVGLALAIIGWGVELGKRQRERFDKEREEREEKLRADKARQEALKTARQRGRLKALRTMLVEDFVHAALEYHKLKAQNSEWHETLSAEFEQIGTAIEAKKTRTLEESLIRDAGTTLSDGNIDRGIDHLRALVYLFVSSISEPAPQTLTVKGQTLQTVLELLASPVDASRQSEAHIEKLLDAALALWDEYNEDARELCVFLVEKMLIAQRHIVGQTTTAESADPMKGKVFADGKFRPGWRFLRDPRLVDAFPSRLRDLLRNYAYEPWPIGAYSSTPNPVVTGPPDMLTPDLLPLFLPLDWARLDPDRLGVDDLAGIIDLPSVYAGKSFAQGPVLLAGETRAIRNAIAHKACVMSRGIFPVTLTLPDPLAQRPQESRSHLQSIGAAVGAAWLQLLRSREGASAFLDLPLPAQRLVSRLIVTVTGSPAACEHRLGIAGQRDLPADKRMLLRRLSDVAENGLLTDPNELISCLEIRPPGLQQTWIVVDLHADGFAHPRQITQCLALAPSLQRCNVLLHVFTSSLQTVPSLAGMQSVALIWSDRQQEDMLNKLIHFASGKIGPEKYSELTGPDPRVSLPPLEQLIGLAGGSFSRLAGLVRDALCRAAQPDLAAQPAREPPGS